MPPEDYVGDNEPENATGEEVEQETYVEESQNLQVTWETITGVQVTKLLTVTEVTTGDSLVEFWYGNKLVLMVREMSLVEAYDVNEIMLGDE